MALKCGIKWDRPVAVVEVPASIHDAEIYRFAAVGINRTGRGTVVDRAGYGMGKLGSTYHDNDLVVERLRALLGAYQSLQAAFQEKWAEEIVKLLPITEETR